jgi:hypothetical protein
MQAHQGSQVLALSLAAPSRSSAARAALDLNGAAHLEAGTWQHCKTQQACRRSRHFILPPLKLRAFPKSLSTIIGF